MLPRKDAHPSLHSIHNPKKYNRSKNRKVNGVPKEPEVAHLYSCQLCTIRRSGKPQEQLHFRLLKSASPCVAFSKEMGRGFLWAKFKSFLCPSMCTKHLFHPRSELGFHFPRFKHCGVNILTSDQWAILIGCSATVSKHVRRKFGKARNLKKS